MGKSLPQFLRTGQTSLGFGVWRVNDNGSSCKPAAQGLDPARRHILFGLHDAVKNETHKKGSDKNQKISNRNPDFQQRWKASEIWQPPSETTPGWIRTATASFRPSHLLARLHSAHHTRSSLTVSLRDGCLLSLNLQRKTSLYPCLYEKRVNGGVRRPPRFCWSWPALFASVTSPASAEA